AWLALSLVTMIVNLAIRALRWQYLLEPLGTTSFGNAFRATTVGFAASTVLPARAGEVIRPYFLARHEHMSATGAFATIILERLLVAFAWSFPLWLSIDAGIWAVAVAFGFNMPFTSSFLIVPLLTLGVAVPTPGAIGGFHEAFRLGATVFYGVPNDGAVAAAL